MNACMVKCVGNNFVFNDIIYVYILHVRVRVLHSEFAFGVGEYIRCW